MLTKTVLIKLISGVLSALLATTGVSATTNNGNISTQQVESFVAEAINNNPEINTITTSDTSATSEETKTEATQAQPATKAASVPLTTSKVPVTRGPVDLTAAAREAFDLINDYRTSNGYSALEWSEADAAVARVRAKELASNFSHTSASGTTTNGGENIAKSNTFASNEASIIVNGWINSPGHRANILRPNFVSAGLAVYESNGIYYWSNNFTQRMAVPGDKGTTTTKSTENGGTITVTDNNDGSVLSVGCDVIPDSEGWVTGHFEIEDDMRDEDVFGDGSLIVRSANVMAVTDTGIARSHFNIVENGSFNLHGIRVTWNDIKNGRKFKVRFRHETRGNEEYRFWEEVKWIN